MSATEPGPAEAADAARVSPGEAAFRQGLEAYRRGAFEQAVSRWSEAAESAEREGRPGEHATARAHLAQAYQALGQHKTALVNLETALELAKASGDRARIASIMAALGSGHLAFGSLDKAQASLDAALIIARELGHARLSASILNTLGNLAMTRKKHGGALAAYRESVDLARQAGDRVLIAVALTNVAVAWRLDGQSEQSWAALDLAFAEARRLPATHDQVYGLITIGTAYAELARTLPASHDVLVRLAGEALGAAVTGAHGLDDRRALSYASGHLGALYEDERRYAEALQLTRRAVLAAQHVNAPESLYRWQWQTGRLLRELGRIDEAIASYRRAVQTLQAIRPELSTGAGVLQRSFRESVGDVYFELVDLLLRQAASIGDAEPATPYLIESRDVVELLKVAELRDYFRDDCVDAALGKLTSLDVVSQTAIVVYPILLRDRLELLVSLPRGLRRFSVPIGRDALTREVRQFRRTLEKRTTREYLLHAQRLYDWLIRPLEAALNSARLDTLIFVPDGPLRTIPMAALHDGSRFLVAKYSLATTPSLNLTDPRPLKRENTRVLAVGLTQSVQGFPPLPNVAQELRALQQIFPSTTLLDRDFVLESMERKLKDELFSIVHMASHGQFASEVGESFLLAFDKKLTIDRLEEVIGRLKFRDQPLELLTLSACETAAGDDRAALGLAGVAVKAGARSALATLWSVSDEATADLVAEFYRQLQDPRTSRALALQRAQLKLLADPRYRHPGLWSPFLLINNWL
jgi:CHAT domain-containing protein/Tfp pilus assembly protein PilF